MMRVNFQKKYLQQKNQLIIIGESALELKSGKYIFEEIKKFLKKITLLIKNGTP